MAFNLGPLYDAESRFERDFVDFSKLWASVRENWLDHKRDEFQREHLSTLGPSLNRFCTALQEFCDKARKADHLLADEENPSEEHL